MSDPNQTPADLNSVSDAELIELSLQLGRQIDEFRQRRIQIKEIIEARRARVAALYAEAAALEAGGGVSVHVPGQVVEIKAGVEQ